jgi:ABC-2 type transport system ATP-binding protein
VAQGPLDEVRGSNSLEGAFIELAGVETGGGERLSWLGP